MEKPYLYLAGWREDLQGAIDATIVAERRGFPGVYSESPGDNITLSMALLDRTERITVGTGIAGIYLRHADTAASAATMIEALYPGRFVLGLGASYVPFREDMDVSYGTRPLRDMRNYVRQIREVAGDDPLPPVLVGALRQKMTRLSGEVADGIMWANAARSHLPFSFRQLPDNLPDGFLLSNSVPTCVSDDLDAAMVGIRRYLLFYMKLPNYQNYWVEAGYGERVEAARRAIERDDDEAVMASMDEAMLLDIAAFGSADDLREQIEHWQAAGINQLVLDPISASGDRQRAMYEVIDALGDV